VDAGPSEPLRRPDSGTVHSDDVSRPAAGPPRSHPARTPPRAAGPTPLTAPAGPEASHAAAAPQTAADGNRLPEAALSPERAR